MGIDINKLKIAKESFCNLQEESYKDYLQQKLSNPEKILKWDKSVYLDPDTTRNNPNSPFFKQLEEYLNRKEIYLNTDRKWSYKFENSYINVYDGNKIVLKLISDQLGFSAPIYSINRKEEKGWTSKGLVKYPYAKYLLNNKEDIKIILQIIKNTRSLGGSFIWPIGTYKSVFNINKGVGGFIDDRADITLDIIRYFYILYNKGLSDEDIKLNMKNLILLNGDDADNIMKWLKHFDTFENYIKFFSFHNFVDIENDYRVYNLSSNPNRRTYLDKEKRIYEMDNEQLENILININNQTVDRTNKMLEKSNETNKK